MDQGQPLALPDLPDPEQPKTQKTETINGQAFPVGTVDEFALAVWKRPLKRDAEGLPILPRGLVLGIRKFKTIDKFYRLVWRGRLQEWLAAEDVTNYYTRKRCQIGGTQVARGYGAFFDEVT